MKHTNWWINLQPHEQASFMAEYFGDDCEEVNDTQIEIIYAHSQYASQQAPASTPPVSAREDGWVKAEEVIERLKKYRDTEMEKHLSASGLNFAINELTELLVNKK